jgi:hypothetical protein
MILLKPKGEGEGGRSVGLFYCLILSALYPLLAKKDKAWNPDFSLLSISLPFRLLSADASPELYNDNYCACFFYIYFSLRQAASGFCVVTLPVLQVGGSQSRVKQPDQPDNIKYYIQ